MQCNAANLLPHAMLCPRRTLAMLGDAGFDAIAPDWPGHGDSAKPPASAGFDYGRDAYLSALDAFVKAVGIKQPYALVVQARTSD
jgi:pimeloyl-ACP methyl ester carboxylesterase